MDPLPLRDDVEPIHLSTGSNLLGWFGSPTTSAALLAAYPVLDTIWWFNPVAQRWISDSEALPSSLRSTIAIRRGIGFVAVAAHPATIYLHGSGRPVVNTCPVNTDPPDADDPAIIVTIPQPGGVAVNPLVVAGRARVFEANVRLRLLDAGGAVLVDTFTTATVGGPEFGDFSAEIGLRGAGGPACLQIFEEDASDGRDRNVVQVPIILS